MWTKKNNNSMEKDKQSTEERRQELIEKVRKLKTYVGGIPSQIVHSNTSFKVRRGWFQSILLDLDWLLRAEKDLISEEAHREFSGDIEKLSNLSEELTTRLTTQADIDFGDTILDKILEELGK